MRDSITDLRIAIVNPTTLVGNELKLLLNERGIPFAAVELYDSSPERAGTLTEVGDSPAVVQPLSAESLAGTDVVFFCGSGEEVEPWIRRADKDGYVAIDLTQPSALSHEGIPVVAGVNADSVRDGATIIVSPHPIAVIIVLVAAALKKAGKIKLCTASVLQPASEFGQAGIDELFEQTVKVLNMESQPREVFDRQLAFNYYPARDSRSLEQYVLREIEAVAGHLPVSISILQGTAFHGHTVSMFVQLEEDLPQQEIVRALRDGSGIEMTNEDSMFSALDAAGKDRIMIGLVEKDPRIPASYWLWIAADNLRRSSALNAVLLVEELISRSAGKPN